MQRLPERQDRPGANRAVSKVSNGDGPSLGQTADHFVKRLLHDCLAEATAAYWLRRAETFEAVGTPSCDEIARACRARAHVSTFEDHRDVVTALLQEVS